MTELIYGLQQIGWIMLAFVLTFAFYEMLKEIRIRVELKDKKSKMDHRFIAFYKIMRGEDD